MWLSLETGPLKRGLILNEVIKFSSVQSLSHVQLFVTPWIAAHQASLSITNSQSSPRLTSIESVMHYNHLILCLPFLLLPSIFPSIRVFSNESALLMRWPKYWSFSFSIIPSKEIPGKAGPQFYLCISISKPIVFFLKHYCLSSNLRYYQF